MVAIESKDDLYVIDLLEDFDEFYLELEHFAEENRVPIIDKIGIRFLIQMLKIKKAKNLSGGMQRRLSIAMALISEPQILFLDEPTLGLDVLARRELWASIKSLKGKVTIILTTHYMDEVENLSDRVGIMTKGQLTAVGTVAELTTQTGTSKLEDAFSPVLGNSDTLLESVEV